MGEWKHIITIGREYGAGGRSVAKRISDLLGIPHYDKEIIQLAAEKTGLSEEMIRGTEEHESGKTLLNWFLPSGSASAYDQAILAQAQTIRKIAEQGPCVIVGRGADYILRDFPHLVNVFLYAEKKDKVRYAMETYGESYEQAVRRVRHADAARLRPDAGQDGRARPEREQPLQERADVAVVMRLSVFQPGQQAGLRDVRRDEVSLRAERAEHGGEVRLQPGIQRAVVGHDGEAREEVERLIHLSSAAEIAGVDHVELQAKLLPVVRDRRERERLIAEALEGGVRRENGRRQHGAFQPHGGEHRQRNGQRAFSDAGQVLHGDDSFHNHDSRA